ncbi:MAG: response regulator [Blautia sp.]|nr:response regulator [Eubacteriales bacterium]MED9966105.1 response regulator [Blautia sp.]
MLKVFLVEDEMIIRNGVKNNIPWEQEGFTFVGEAGDGELAWPLIKQTKPDILITDIRMPFMDGLELSGLVRKELPDTKIIILSGYSEFDYAKQAINLGVANYLLKPISGEKLLEAVKQVADIIREERAQALLVEQYRQENQENIKIEKIRLFEQIVTGSSTTREILDRGELLELDLAAPFYTVILLKLVDSGESMDSSTQVMEASEKVDEAIMQKQEFFAVERGLEGLAILMKSEEEMQAGIQLESLEKEIQEILAQYPEVSYFGGAGETVQRMRDIRRSYVGASKAFASRFFTEKNRFLTVEQIREQKPVGTKDMSLKSVDASKINRKLVEDFLKSGLEEETKNFVEEYFRNIGRENYESLMFCHYLIVDMNLCASHFLESIGIEPSLLPAQCRDVGEFLDSLQCEEGMIAYVTKLFTETIRLRDNSSRNKYMELITAAQKIILENFQNNEFSMNQAAAMVNLSPGYFSTLFRQETGMSFVEYLTGIRLEKAKALLMCTNMRSSEIAYEVGYKDAHYFSYIFKKVCGCTPKEYRARKSEDNV